MFKQLFCREEGDGKTWLRVLMYTCAVIGAWKLLVFMVRTAKFIWRHVCRCKQTDLFRKYGRTNEMDTTYALVTGGSDGIGLELCEQLA